MGNDHKKTYPFVGEMSARCFVVLLAFIVGGLFPNTAHSESLGSCIRRQIDNKNEFNALQLALSLRESAMIWLARLNPQLDEKTLSAKIGAADSAFMFYRSFVTNFYDALKTSPLKMNALAPLLSHTGWMLGDVHPGNFGAVLHEDGTPAFTMNDLDDGGHGPLVLDLVRFMGASRLADSTLDLAGIINAYREGLEGAPAPKCRYVSKIVKEAGKSGKRPASSDYNAKAQVLIRSSKETRNVRNTDLKRLETALDSLFPGKFKMHDAVEVIRSKGGSGGLHRYRVLLKYRHDPGAGPYWVVMELKEMVGSGMAAFAVPGPPSPKERIDQGLRYTVGGDHSSLFRFAQVKGVPMTVRPRFEGGLNIDLVHVHGTDLSSLILFEAWKLGEIHSRSADDPASYLRAIRQFPAESLSDISEDIASGFEAVYGLVRSHP